MKVLPPQVSLKSILLERNFVLMWIAMFISTLGTFVLLLALSSKTYSNTGSAGAAGIIFVAQWLAPLFTFALIGKIANEGSSKRRLATTDFLAGAVSIFVGLMWSESWPAVLVALVVRGFLEALNKTLRDASLKRLCKPEHLEKAASIFSTSYFVGIGAGALLSAYLITRLSLFQIAVLDGLTFVVSGLVYLLIREEVRKPAEAIVMKPLKLLGAGIKVIFNDPPLFKAFVYLLLTAGVFQGFHTVARAALPIGLLALPESSLQYFQASFTSGVILGSLFVSKYLQSNSTLTFRPIFYMAATSVFMIAACVTKIAPISFAFYFLFAFAFEICFTKFKNELFLRTPSAQIGHVMAFTQTALTSFLALCILSFGYFIDHSGLVPVVWVIGILVILIAMLVRQKFLQSQNCKTKS